MYLNTIEAIISNQEDLVINYLNFKFFFYNLDSSGVTITMSK